MRKVSAICILAVSVGSVTACSGMWARVHFLADEEGRVTGLRFYGRFVVRGVEGL